MHLQCCGRCRLSLLAIGNLKACGCEDSEESIGRDSQMPLQHIRRVRTFPYTLDLESMELQDCRKRLRRRSRSVTESAPKRHSPHYCPDWPSMLNEAPRAPESAQP